MGASCFTARIHQLIHFRIPHSERPGPDPLQRADDASEQWNDDTEDEIQALEDLTEAGCAAAPKLLSWTEEQQDNTMWVPGGYIVYILMEKLPGAPPMDFWVEGRYSLEDRNAIRAAFRKALRYAFTANLRLELTIFWQRGKGMRYYSYGPRNTEFAVG